MVNLMRTVFLILILFPLAVFAKEYQVELLVFSHITPTALQSEQWPINQGISIPANASLDTKTWTVASPPQFTLKKEENKITAQPDYRVLYHRAWRVSGNSLARQKVLFIQNNPDNPELDGTLSISLNRYFNVHLQLALNTLTSNIRDIADNPAFADAPDDFHFILDQKRRMRSRELNYLAHPLFAALIQIIPIKK